MTIRTENQRNQIDKLINEGIVCQSSNIEAQKSFIRKLQDLIASICNENDEEMPLWIYKINIPKVIVRPEICVEDEKKFYSESVSMCIQELTALQSDFDRQLELENNRIQIKYLRWSLILALFGVIVAIFVPIYIANYCTSQVEISHKQFDEIMTILYSDSIICIP